jgi:hypothetical protein
VNLALSEAALFGLNGSEADAQDYYKKGIEAALNWSSLWYQTTSNQISDLFAKFDPSMSAAAVAQYDASHAISSNDIDAFLNSAPVVTLTGDQEQKLEMIINQKMLSFYPTMVFEGWAEWRRTGYPRVLIGDDNGDLQGVGPRRFMYPVYEQDLNKENYSEVVQRIGSDHLLTKVWWDANPQGPHEHPGEVEWRDTPWLN